MTAKIAKGVGFFNTFVTNGYMTTNAVREIAPYLDAATVDFKGAADPEFYRKYSSVPAVNPIFESLMEMKRNEIHIEVTNLIVPKIGDSVDRLETLAKWVYENLGRDTPFHLLRFHPDYQMTTQSATTLKALEEAHNIVHGKVGLNYVYIGNAPGHSLENTYCPNCRELLIKRFSFEIVNWRLTEDLRCPSCGRNIAIHGKFYPGGVSYPHYVI